jgi:uncharacterized membrane protein
MLTDNAFDPYPYIFLNLLLSMLAALQAPVIMMSQNRQAAKDRLAAAMDYEVNLKSETEIAALNDKVDRLQAQIDKLIALQTVASSSADLSLLQEHREQVGTSGGAGEYSRFNLAEKRGSF